ncbi:NAD(P)-dependent oxidoreductase [Mesorhizobium sp. M0142]|uniref:NAD-dependent epimerase/dehydratase family protein n=1 Tax=unclassified Mesorhizobium TaxID=325217 RepID=UPI0033394554
MTNPQRVLVTGGAGFIGWRCARNLAKDGARVLIADNLSVGMPMPDMDGCETREIDIRDKSGMVELAEGFKPDTIIHLAAIHHIPTCERQRAYALDVNVVGTEIVLDAAEKAGVGTVVLASSGAVYDWVDAPLDEDATRTWPCDNYALSKLTNESQLRFWADRTGGRGRVARIFNTIGHDDPNAHLIPDILNQLYNAKGQARIALGNLKPRRDYIHAEDTAAGVAALAGDTGEASFDVMNIGSGRDASVEELVRLIGAAMKVDIEIVEDKARLRRVDRATQLAKVDKIGNRVGWSAKIELPAAVADIVRGFPFKKAG